MGGKSGKIRQETATHGGENGKDVGRTAASTPSHLGLPSMGDARDCHDMEFVQVPAALDNAVVIELIYHRTSELSRW
jgi:hypothetical protein